jgi:septum formation protein
MKNIILASASERRITLLKKWGLNFEILPSNIKEQIKFKRPSAIVKDLSLQKAKAVQKQRKDFIIISADTIVVLNGKIIGKPKNKKHALQILKELNGSRHKVYTGVTIISPEKQEVFYDVATVKMRKIKPEQIKFLSKKNLDKAGAYAVQDKQDNFVEKIYGDYYTVVGLPYFKLKEKLKQFDIKI